MFPAVYQPQKTWWRRGGAAPFEPWHLKDTLGDTKTLSSATKARGIAHSICQPPKPETVVVFSGQSITL